MFLLSWVMSDRVFFQLHLVMDDSTLNFSYSPTEKRKPLHEENIDVQIFKAAPLYHSVPNHYLQ